MNRFLKFSALGLFFLHEGMASAEDFCEQAGDLAQLVMTKRQNGAAMQDVMKVIAPEEKDSPNGKFTKAVIIAAYERPRYNGEEMKKSSITDFQNSFYLECIKSVK